MNQTSPEPNVPSDKKIAVIGIPGKWSTEVLADALEAQTGYRLVLDMAQITADLATGTLWADVSDNTRINLCDLDGIAVKKITQDYNHNTLDRLEILRLAEAQGVRVFSRPETMIRMIDRLACTMTLSNGGIPMPKTVVTENPQAALKAVHQFGAAVFKPLYSTKARGMCVIDAAQSDQDILQNIADFQAQNPMMYIQQKLSLSGQDYGMIFLGGEYKGTYARVAQAGSWNTTIHSGGKYIRHDPPQSTIDLASKAERLFNMDFTTVDVADTDQGPIVFEVSAFGGFRGAQEGIGYDAAHHYAAYILEQVKT